MSYYSLISEEGREGVEKKTNKQNQKQTNKRREKIPNPALSDADVIPHHQHKDAQLCSQQWLLWNSSFTVIIEHDDDGWCDAGLCGQFSHLSQQCPLIDSSPPPVYLWVWG